MKRITFAFVLFLILLQIPYLNTFLKTFNTLFHESGHALVAIVTGNKVESVSLFSNTEGLAITEVNSWLSGVLISLSGYVIASICAYLFAILWKKDKHTLIIYIMLGVVLVNMLFWVRNMYGIFYLLVVFLALYFLLKKTTWSGIVPYVTLILVLLLVSQSVNSSFHLLVIHFNESEVMTDALNLKKQTFIPAFVWSMLFFVQAVVFAFLAILELVKFRKKPLIN